MTRLWENVSPNAGTPARTAFVKLRYPRTALGEIQMLWSGESTILVFRPTCAERDMRTAQQLKHHVPERRRVQELGAVITEKRPGRNLTAANYVVVEKHRRSKLGPHQCPNYNP